MQVLECQVQAFGLRSENDEESWEAFYREAEEGQYVRMINQIKMCTVS